MKIFFITTILVLIILLAFLAASLPFYPNNYKSHKSSERSEINSFVDCVSKIEERVVRGNSMSGIAENGETVKILFGYYKCHPIKRDEIVAYKYAGNPEPLIKIVKALPGDSFKLKKTSGGWNIAVNGEILKNFQNQQYVLNEKGYKMLSLYENDYKGIIPRNAYLILGNQVNGSLDSTHFGLVDKGDILGKIEKRIIGD